MGERETAGFQGVVLQGELKARQSRAMGKLASAILNTLRNRHARWVAITIGLSLPFWKTGADIAGAAALLTRLAGRLAVKDPQQDFPGLTWTALDVGGPCVGAFGMISENSSPLRQGR